MTMDLPSISVRKFYRLNDDPPEEKMSVLVLTSKAKYYVDIRVHLTPEGALPSTFGIEEDIKHLHWAFAGTSKTTPPVYEAEELKQPAHTMWSHWIDSMTLDEVNDEGDMIPQPNGTVLEKGVNKDPVTGVITDTYEESWLDLGTELVEHEKLHPCFVLRIDEPSKHVRGMAIRIGQYVQGILRIGNQIAAVRWQWFVDTGEWKKSLGIGSGQDMIPCDILFNLLETNITVNQTVLATNELEWTCVEAFLCEKGFHVNFQPSK